MKIVLTCLIIFFICQSRGQESSSPYKIIILDKNIKSEELAPHQVVARTFNLPAKKERDEAYYYAEFSKEEISKLDELDKDLLWIDSKNLSIKELVLKYPDLSLPSIQKLKKMANK